VSSDDLVREVHAAGREGIREGKIQGVEFGRRQGFELGIQKGVPLGFMKGRESAIKEFSDMGLWQRIRGLKGGGA
jgi:flagellar biosynthesis/type III secretory pathway protein FliH